jgi:hypothetical protein
MCEITESESMERRLDWLAAENEQLKAEVSGAGKVLDSFGVIADRDDGYEDDLEGRVLMVCDQEAMARQERDGMTARVRLLAAEVERFRERAELAERERDRLLDSYINLGTREDVRRFFGLDVLPAGGVMVRTPEQYELGYAVASGFTVQGGPFVRREPYRLVRRLPDGNYLVEDPSAIGPASDPGD